MNRLTAHQKRIFVQQSEQMLISKGFERVSSPVIGYKWQKESKKGFTFVDTDANDYLFLVRAISDDKQVNEKFANRRGRIQISNYDIYLVLNEFSNFLKSIL